MAKTSKASLVVSMNPKDNVIKFVERVVKRSLALPDSFEVERTESTDKVTLVFRLTPYLTLENHEIYLNTIYDIANNEDLRGFTGTTAFKLPSQELYYGYYFGNFPLKPDSQISDWVDEKDINGKKLVVRKTVLQVSESMKILKQGDIRIKFLSDEPIDHAKGLVTVWGEGTDKYSTVRVGKYAMLLQNLLFGIDTDDESTITEAIIAKGKEIDWQIDSVAYSWH